LHEARHQSALPRDPHGKFFLLDHFRQGPDKGAKGEAIDWNRPSTAVFWLR
jgi:hypothetical protein